MGSLHPSISTTLFNYPLVTWVPKFKGEKYEYWSIQMRSIFISMDLWQLVQDGYEIPKDDGEEKSWDETTVREYEENQRRDHFALSLIYRGLEDTIFPTVVGATTAMETWRILQKQFKGFDKEPSSIDDEINAHKGMLGCPICFAPLTMGGDSSLSIKSPRGTTLSCTTCKKMYSGNESYFDLTTGGGAKIDVESVPFMTKLFSTSLMSFLYERGWRQNFRLGGFPGPDKEFEMAKEYLKPVFGGNIVDASCGSGVFSRRFVKSGLFSVVVALDYSKSMLQQCHDFVKDDEQFPKEKIVPVRADIARLPLVSSSIDAVHAGAALHCWPSPSTAVAEISRVLRPGGVFVATTAVADGVFSMLPFKRFFRENLDQFVGLRVFLSENELEDLCTTCGFVGFTCIRNGPFIMIAASKPY